MTPQQSRAARGLLGWTQKQLATRARREVSTVSYYEGGRRGVSLDVVADMKKALEEGGIEFIAQGRGKGFGVRFANPVDLQGELDVSVESP